MCSLRCLPKVDSHLIYWYIIYNTFDLSRQERSGVFVIVIKLMGISYHIVFNRISKLILNSDNKC
jgi:hypothetical protein